MYGPVSIFAPLFNWGFYKFIISTGVLARSAEVSLINYENRIFTNYLGLEKVIVHKGLSHWNKNYINEKWEESIITALGNSTYQKIKAEKLSNFDKIKKQKSMRTKLVQQKVSEWKKTRPLQKRENSAAENEKNNLKIEEEKRLNETLRLREEILKNHKNIQPYQF